MHSLAIAKTKFGRGDDAAETPQLFHYSNHLHNSFQHDKLCIATVNKQLQYDYYVKYRSTESLEAKM